MVNRSSSVEQSTTLLQIAAVTDMQGVIDDRKE